MFRHLDFKPLACGVALVLIVSAVWTVRAQSFYDVIVVGSEPEGIVAAVAAAREGASVLLVSEHEKLGGLFVMGQMNSLDLRSEPELYQRGLFEDWWRRVGRGTSFDVRRAERAFVAMLREQDVEVRKGVRDIAPMLEDAEVVGVTIDAQPFPTSQVVDATADADFAAAAGASFSFGFESLGYRERMVDTLVFRIDGIDWRSLQRGVKSRGKSYASVNDDVAWGHFGGYPAAYRAEEEGIRLRGLNLGRQEDGSVLVNALLIYGIDPFSRESVAEGFERAEREAPRIIDYLRREIPGFDKARYGGVADALYIRETRHLEAECILSVLDVLGNRVTPLDVAAGGYPLDVQTLTPYDNGYVYGTPEIYGVQLCVTVPEDLDGLWVVGKAAGYDPLAASSARVVPFGMALAEAVGMAAARAGRAGLSPGDFAADEAAIESLRTSLRAHGAYLPEVETREASGPVEHPYFAAYQVLLSRGLALGGYENTPRLDAPMMAIGYVYLLSNVGQRFLGDAELGKQLVQKYQGTDVPLTPDLALAITRDAACLSGLCPDDSREAMRRAGILPEELVLDEGEALTRGEMYALAVRLIERLGPESSR